jgi:lipoprotein-anchoring transpeptidase ErfK/SrfK
MLEGQGREWTFTTPVGLFHVLRKEKNPVWVAPDWWYVERGERIPPPNQRATSVNTLGTSALFLGDGIAIHGTDRPQLLVDFIDPDDRRVSHGCIRLTNEAARELYHRVEVGTPVLIF